MKGFISPRHCWRVVPILLTAALVPMPVAAQSAGSSLPWNHPDFRRPAAAAQTNALPVPTVDLEVATRNLSLPPLGSPDLFLPVPGAEVVEIALRIDLSDRRVYVYEGDRVKTSFPIAIGRQGWETPTGEFEVMQMLRNPAWQHPFNGSVIPPGPNNPLGVRWIGFWTDGRNYIGFHGTPNEESVGRPASHGCIRMFNRDVVQLFNMVKMGTPVSVVP